MALLLFAVDICSLDKTDSIRVADESMSEKGEGTL